MNKTKVNLEGFTLVGISARTNNKNEMNPSSSKIGSIMNLYWGNQMANEFIDRVNPGVTYAVYTDYESDEHGDYTYFLGEEVKSNENQDSSKFNSLVIPASTYQKFTTNSGKMPGIIIKAWQEIWQMSSLDFEGKRKYKADFEVYDKRASDSDNAVVDIYIGILEDAK